MRCPGRHGRLITFFNFLREKNFIRPLSAAQIEELRQNVRTVNCSNCGAPIDLAKGRRLRALRLAALDARRETGGGARAALQKAGAGPQPVDKAALPLELARARRDVSDAFARFADQPSLVRLD